MNMRKNPLVRVLGLVLILLPPVILTVTRIDEHFCGQTVNSCFNKRQAPFTLSPWSHRS